ncbi:hypothetical protein OIU85_001974 [Salix viminalis]|uniref:Uncharacterized protein n=1 Tax=Salix viminalis TaxID=40686 RepID=A0A9Q0VMR9_SALVM|nr:hypothetical protein OIU85_001974 [Salix viminalis]
MAIIGNVHSDLTKLLMSARSINVNVRDADGMTPLDLLRQWPHSASSDILMRQLISAGGIFGCQDYTTRRAIASRLKMQGNGGSPGSSFRISDNEIFLYTGIEIASDAYADPATAGVSPSSSELSHPDQTNDNHGSTLHKRRDSFSYAAQQLKRGSVASGKKCSGSEETPTPLRQRFSNASSIPNNKRTLSVRSNQSSPTAKKKLASGIMHGVVQGLPQVTIPGRSRSSSFSKSSISSPGSLDKQKGVFIESDVAGPSTSNRLFDDGTPKVKEKEGSTSKKSRSQSVRENTSEQAPEPGFQSFCYFSGLIKSGSSVAGQINASTKSTNKEED